MRGDLPRVLKKRIAAGGGSTRRGRRGLLRARRLKHDEDALRLIVEAIGAAGYRPGEDLMSP